MHHSASNAHNLFSNIVLRERQRWKKFHFSIIIVIVVNNIKLEKHSSTFSFGQHEKWSADRYVSKQAQLVITISVEVTSFAANALHVIYN